MNAVDVIVGQYNRTILELQTRIVQAALELAQAQEELAELKKPKSDKPQLEAVKNDAAAS